MAYIDDIRKAVKVLGHQDESYSIICTVDAINGNTCDVTPYDETVASLTDVWLVAKESSGNIILPKIGSTVVVTLMDRTNAFVSLYSDITAVQLIDNTFGGLVKVQELTTKLNNLENLLNGFIQIFNTHTHPYVNVMAPAITSPTTSQETQTLTPTIVDDLENKDVKHGPGN